MWQMLLFRRRGKNVTTLILICSARKNLIKTDGPKSITNILCYMCCLVRICISELEVVVYGPTDIAVNRNNCTVEDL